MKKFVIASIVLLLLVLPINIFAQSCSDQDPCANIGDLQQKADCYQNVSSVCRSQSDTLSSQITYMNSQIQLTTLRINSTKAKINTLLIEIDQLVNEVQRLEGVLDSRLSLLIHRVPESYKRSAVSQFGMLLFSRNITDFIKRTKYLQTVQQEDAAIVFQVKSAQNSYNESKQVREDKTKQLEQIKAELERQNRELAQQTQAKNALLSATQGNESRYQQLLEQAKAQIAGFLQFTGGLALLTNQTVCNDWGCYYNQRDSRWAGYTLGNSSYSIAQAGCLVTSLSMVATHYKKTITPTDIAANSANFFGSSGFLYVGTITVNGVSITRNQYGNLDSELSSGRPVIVGLSLSTGSHFIVIKEKRSGEYIMNDPVVENGHDINFSSRYNLGEIVEVDTVRIN
jgi:peptidoglycan hydrolase CwlO-like protein